MKAPRLAFAYLLARDLGRANVECPGGLLDEITSWQLDRWMQFYASNPTGDERADLRSALAATAICQSFGNDQITPADLLDYYGKIKAHESFEATSDVLTQAYMVQLAARVNAQFGEVPQ